MTCYPRPSTRPDYTFYGFHHVEHLCGNAKQASDWICARMGFHKIAYRGLETGDREYSSHVCQQGRIFMIFTSPLLPIITKDAKFIAKHGNAVYDIAFRVDECALIYKKAIKRGAKSVSPPKKYTDEYGSVIKASIKTYGDCIHTLIQNVSYKGPFLPGFKAVEPDNDPLLKNLPEIGLEMLDHCVGNQPEGKLIEVANWYKDVLDFHQFWSVDDTQVHTDYSALRSIVMCDYDRIVKLPLNEPAPGKRPSQIKEYVDYHGGPGVQHIALRTRDIIKAVKNLKARGMKFLTIPDEYYDDLRLRLKDSVISVQEDMDILQSLNILVDFDDRGYLLQIFTEEVEDRPTLFYEVIQRRNNDGFGAGNFKALFTAIEIAQDKRGNLHEAKEMKVEVTDIKSKL